VSIVLIRGGCPRHDSALQFEHVAGDHPRFTQWRAKPPLIVSHCLKHAWFETWSHDPGNMWRRPLTSNINKQRSKDNAIKSDQHQTTTTNSDESTNRPTIKQYNVQHRNKQAANATGKQDGIVQTTQRTSSITQHTPTCCIIQRNSINASFYNCKL